MFLGRSKFHEHFWKGSPKEHSCEFISKSDQRFLRRRFLKNCLINSISLPWQPEFLMESNSVFKFWRGPPNEHSCQVWSKRRCGRRRCLQKLLTMHDRHLATLKAPLEHVVLRWAKKTTRLFNLPSNRLWNSSSLINILYTKLFTRSFNLAWDFIKIMMSSQWVLKVCVNDHVIGILEWFHLNTDEVRCRYGIGRVLTNVGTRRLCLRNTSY